MSLRRITATDAIAQLGAFSAIIDARSESEYAEDRLPGAVNWPVLNDAQRVDIGTHYKQASPFDARKRGAVMVARNIASHVETHAAELPRSWRPLVYCWRGGQRSGSLALVLGEIGFQVNVLDGGYREFRRAVLVELETQPAQLQFRVLCGRTGSAKSRLLQTLVEHGAQVLDLEDLACHRGSVLGPEPGRPQPSQKAFETSLWQALRGYDHTRPVFVEGESRTIGRLRLPEPLLVAVRDAPCLQVQMPLIARVQFLLHDYVHFVTDTESFCARLAALRELRGAAVVEAWQARARSGQANELAGVVQQLLTLHYDPVYERSMQRNFRHYGQAIAVDLLDGSAPTLHAAARHLMKEAADAPA